MYNTSLRIVNNTGDAEDVTQEAFTDAFRSLEDFHYKSTFGAWLKRIVINKSINYLRKRKMDLIDIEKTNIGHLPEEQGMDEQEIQMKVEDIKKAVTLLPNGYRTVLTLYLATALLCSGVYAASFLDNNAALLVWAGVGICAVGLGVWLMGIEMPQDHAKKRKARA